MQPGSWRSILFIFLYAEVIAACHGKSLALVGDVAKAFAVTPSQASWVISAVALVAALFAPVIGWGIDQIGERRAIRGGLVIALISSFLIVFAPNFSTLIALRTVEGFGYIAVVLGALALLIRTTEGKRQTTALAFWSVASPLGGAIALFAVAPVVGTGLWRWVFGVHAGLLFVLLLLTPFLPEPIAKTGPRRKVTEILAIYKVPAVLALCGGLLLLQIFKLGSGSAIPTYLMTHLHVQPAAIGLISSTSILLSVAGGLSAGFLINRGVRAGGIAIFGAAVSAFASYLIYAPSLGLFTVLGAMFLGAISGGMLYAWINTMIPKVAPSTAEIGATSGAVSQLLYIGMAFGPPVVFAALEQPDRSALYLLITLAYLLPVLVIYGQWKRRANQAAVV